MSNSFILGYVRTRLAVVQDQTNRRFRQPVTDWVETLHTTNGFSRERMGAERALTCDKAIRHLINKYCPTGEVEQSMGVRIIDGKPLVA